jgi:AcrR family transcriptional regulator
MPHPEAATTAYRAGPGRPRSEEADRAIQAATLDLLVEEGFTKMSIEGVAARAGVGKATIYRRWPAKEDLVVDAVVRHCLEHVVSPDTGSLPGDVLALLRATLGKMRRDGHIMQAFAAEQGHHPQLAEAFRSTFLADRRAAAREILERGVARGELPPDADLDLLIDVGPAIMWHRLVVTGLPLDDDLPERIVSQFYTGLGLRPGLST